MGCLLGFDNHNEDERTLPRKDLYAAVLKLREKLSTDRSTETGRFMGPHIVLNVPIEGSFEIKDVECKGWSHSRFGYHKACSTCRYRTGA
jgi:hypothetical protein